MTETKQRGRGWAYLVATPTNIGSLFICAAGWPILMSAKWLFAVVAAVMVAAHIVCAEVILREERAARRLRLRREFIKYKPV